MAIKNDTVFEAWIDALKMIFENGTDFIDTDKRKCRQYLNLLITINNPEGDYEAPLDKLNQMKKWVIPPKDEIAAVMLTKKSSPVYMYAYGPRLFNFQDKVNQINDYLIPMLKKDPTSRRAVVMLWDVQLDSNPGNKEVPGLTTVDFKVQEGKLHVTAIIRSNDLLFGWPANIYQLFILQKYVAQKLDMPTGSLTTFSTSAHLFIEYAEEIQQLIREFME